MADESKVFDVAKPGTSKPETGSKPMVIGHKYIASDPTLAPKKDSDAESAESQESKSTEASKPPAPASARKNVIKPLEPEVADKSEAKTEKQTPKPDEKPAENEQADINDEPISEEEALENAKTEDDERSRIQIQREERLQEMIRTKEYALKIHDSSYGSLRMFVGVFVGVTVLLLAALYLLVDAEILDLGIKLPFELLK